MASLLTAEWNKIAFFKRSLNYIKTLTQFPVLDFTLPNKEPVMIFMHFYFIICQSQYCETRNCNYINWGGWIFYGWIFYTTYDLFSEMHFLNTEAMNISICFLNCVVLYIQRDVNDE
jgi:hypothetical protein